MLAAASVPAVAAGETSAELAGALKHQPKNLATYVRFVGWLDGGRTYALRVTHGRDRGDWAGRDLVELRQVHDALTGAMVGSFRVKRVAEKGGRTSYDKLWRQARPARNWKGFAARHRLARAKPSGRSPDGKWRTAGAAVGRPRFGRFAIKAASHGLSYTWKGFNENESSSLRHSPRARVELRGKTGTHRLLAFQVQHTVDSFASQHLTSDAPAYLAGQVRAYWSPRGDHVLLVLVADQVGISKPADQPKARHYLRSLGPQLKLVARASVAVGARALADRLAKAGLPVARLALDNQTAARRSKTLIYHRGSDGAALAARLAAQIKGPSSIEALRSKGWLRLVVLLGDRALTR